VYTSDPLQSQYQLDKFIKHTLPLSHPSASVFKSTSTGDYANYVVGAAASGAVELDAYDRRNFIWLAGRPTGFSYKDGARLAGDVAFERLAYTALAWSAGGGRGVEDAGKGLHVYRRQLDGSWKLALNIWNSDRLTELRT
jgi:hypothetical protein